MQRKMMSLMEARLEDERCCDADEGRRVAGSCLLLCQATVQATLAMTHVFWRLSVASATAVYGLSHKTTPFASVQGTE